MPPKFEHIVIDNLKLHHCVMKGRPTTHAVIELIQNVSETDRKGGKKKMAVAMELKDEYGMLLNLLSATAERLWKW